MLANLLLGVGIMGLCLLLQIGLLTRALMYYARHQKELDGASFTSTMMILNGVMVLLVLGNLGQVALWALAFQFLGEFASYREAFYHSAVNFSTLGYGDIVMSEKRKLLGPIQAMNGVLMIGISTAAFMTTLRDAVRHNTHGWAAEHSQQIQDMVKNND